MIDRFTLAVNRLLDIGDSDWDFWDRIEILLVRGQTMQQAARDLDRRVCDCGSVPVEVWDDYTGRWYDDRVPACQLGTDTVYLFEPGSGTWRQPVVKNAASDYAEQ